ncbi:hypothetical protein STEG23_008920, partial [Scotinomys teguina]
MRIVPFWASGDAAPHLRRLSQLRGSPALASAAMARGSRRTEGVLALRLFACLLQLALLRKLQRMLKAAPQLVASARVLAVKMRKHGQMYPPELLSSKREVQVGQANKECWKEEEQSQETLQDTPRRRKKWKY